MESVTAEGTAIPQAAILEISGLRIGQPADKAAFDSACRKLDATGLFTAVSYRYKPGPKRGYALTVVLADQNPLAPAAIEIPGIDEVEAWRWLASKFARFDRRVPQLDVAQKFLAGQLEQHFVRQLRGQRLTVRMESDLTKRTNLLSFQPETLPRTQTLSFTGNARVQTADLMASLGRVVLKEEYTDRRFAAAVEMNLRPLYERHGLYRVRLTPGKPEFGPSGVSVAVAIVEGEPFRLGKVDVAGDELPVSRMMAAAKLPDGELADWTQIQTGVWAMEKIVKRTGYFQASAAVEREYDDAAHILNLRVRIDKGPLYHFGELHTDGLPPEVQQAARRVWHMRTGDPYDFQYPFEFLRDLTSTMSSYDVRRFSVMPRRGAGEHVMDVTLVVEPR